MNAGEEKEISTFIVEQQKELGEILTSFEFCNKYIVKTEDGTPIYLAEELGGRTLMRNIFRSMRAFTIEVRDADTRELVLKIERPFKLIFSEIFVYNSANDFLGSVKLKYGFCSFNFIVNDKHNNQVLRLCWSFFKPWTLLIKEGEAEVGKILKKWSGLAKELFTDADNFAIMFKKSLSSDVKSLLLGAVFLVDIQMFEKRPS